MPDKIYGLSCRHVLSLSARFFDELTWGAKVHVDSASNPMMVGVTRAIAGDLAEGNSFDAQLVEASNKEALRQALPVSGLTDYAMSAADLPSAFTIIAPKRRIRARFVDFIDGHYEIDGHTIGHPHLVQSQPETGTDPGESGSPIVSDDGRSLLGMHVAGRAEVDPQGQYLTIAYMIPAWELFKPSNYSNVVGTERWSIVSKP